MVAEALLAASLVLEISLLRGVELGWTGELAPYLMLLPPLGATNLLLPALLLVMVSDV